MLTIEAKAIGQRKPLLSDWSVPAPEGATTLRQLLDRIVRAEVDAFHNRQDDRRLFRVLTAKQVADGAAKGKIVTGLHEEATPTQVNPDEAVVIAVQAFEDGMFLVVIDEVEQKELDRELLLKPDSRVTFIRLSMLAGG